MLKRIILTHAARIHAALLKKAQCDALAIHYGLIMDGQCPMKLAIFAYLHVKPLPLHENFACIANCLNYKSHFDTLLKEPYLVVQVTLILKSSVIFDTVLT